MHNLLSFFKAKPVFFILLPLFFVFHGFTDNFNAVPVKDALLLFLLYTLVSFCFFLIGWLIYRQAFKAGIFSFCVMSFHFFFGAIQDFLKNSFGDSFITRYSFLIPFFFFAFVFLIWLLKKTKKQLMRSGFYLSILFCILILVDAGFLIQKLIQWRSLNDFSATYQLKCNTCQKPDIYLLVFDEYSSSTALKESFNYDNRDLDSFLVEKGFRLLPRSRSNYNFTEFSMASTLNMDYLKIPNPSACTVKDYNNCFELIKTNKVCSFLNSAGYDIINYSIFDLPKSPTPVKEDFLPLKTKLITSQTFISRVKKDLFYHLLVGRFAINWLAKDLIYTTFHNNNKIVKSTLATNTTTSEKPTFLYAHIEMPHPPFYYDKYGNEKSKEQLVKDTREMKVSSYLDYLPKTNEVIKQIVNSIFNHSKKPFAIVLMGDHGYRENQDPNFHFRNLNAVYISSANFSGFYEGLTNVNEFRVLFNNLFNTALPLKKDSTVYLRDKQ